MELTDHRIADQALRAKAWELYLTSFPECERRSEECHMAALQDERYHAILATEEDSQLIAILYYWTFGEMLYVEHIAVNVEMRGRNIGSTILKTLIEKSVDNVIVLEIDPPIDPVSRKRLHFYEKLGFLCTDITFKHPSYSTGEKAHPHDLLILSHGRVISPAEYSDFRENLLSGPLKYVG